MAVERPEHHPALAAMDVEVPDVPEVNASDLRGALQKMVNHLVALTHATRKLADGHATLTGSYFSLASLVRGFDQKLNDSLREARTEARDIGEITARTIIDRKELDELRAEQKARREGKKWLTRRATGRIIDILIAAALGAVGLEALRLLSTYFASQPPH